MCVCVCASMDLCVRDFAHVSICFLNVFGNVLDCVKLNVFTHLIVEGHHVSCLKYLLFKFVQVFSDLNKNDLSYI